MRPRGEQAKLTSGKFGEMAPRKLQPSVESFFRAAAADLQDVALLHQMRIEGKLLRYSMEILAGAFPSVLRTELYPKIEELQSRLGEINDHVTAGRSFRDWTEASQDEALRHTLTSLADQEQAALIERRNQSLNHWSNQHAMALHAMFQQLLAPQPEKQAG